VTELSIEDLIQIYDARLMFEPEIVRRGADNFTDADAAIAREALDRHVEAGEQDRRVEAWQAHTDFHFALYTPCRSAWLIRLATPLWESSQRYRLTMSTLNAEQRRKEAAVEHEQLLAACVAHDGDRAATILHDHLVKSANLITDQMGGERVFSLATA
jgi:DNA-binding GntR family transcriptional regulator